MTNLGTLRGYEHSRGRGINAFGQVVGDANGGPATSRGFLFTNLYGDTDLIDLNWLLPLNSGWMIEEAWDINDLGQIVGKGRVGGESRAFILTPPKPPPACARAFVGIPKCIDARFAAYWETHGGQEINGFPISDPLVEKLEDGKIYFVQYFERVRMEYHPEIADPQYRVLLGQFGRRLHPTDPPSAAVSGMTHFSETGHNVPPDFLTFWTMHGGLTQFGYPISEVITETLEDGKQYEVQYFERARLERHPENEPPYDILLGQFGRIVCGQYCR